jgi:hypothetical protein
MGHPILNPFGHVIKVNVTTLEYLKRYRYLRRHKQTGLKQIRPERARLFLELEPYGLDPRHYKLIGSDFSGPNVCRCFCKKCEGIAAELDHTPRPGPNPIVDAETDAIVKDIKRRRKKKRH